MTLLSCECPGPHDFDSAADLYAHVAEHPDTDEVDRGPR